MNIGKKAMDRVKANLPRYQKVLALAKGQNSNESDTVSIVNDMLEAVFGFEKYAEITSELRINGTYCDLAIKLDGKYENGMLIECKRIGCELNEEHKRQAVHYGADNGINWVVLTNGRNWRLYYLNIEKTVVAHLLFDIDVTTIDLKDEKSWEKFACLTKEGVLKKARDEFFKKSQCLNRYEIGQIILSDPVMMLIRHELRKMGPGMLVDINDLKNAITNDVLNHDIINANDDDCKKAVQRVARFYRKVSKNTANVGARSASATLAGESVQSMSVAEQRLEEAASNGDKIINSPPTTNN